MSRPSLREERRRELTITFARVLAERGQEGASIAAVAEAAGVAPGLVHHHFANKQDLYSSLLDLLVGGFHQRVAARAGGRGEGSLEAYTDAALALDESSDLVAARAWTGLFAEAISDPALFAKMRRVLDAEVAALERRGQGRLGSKDASAVLAYIIGSLVFGAFAPRKAAGFAAPGARRLLRR